MSPRSLLPLGPGARALATLALLAAGLRAGDSLPRNGPAAAREQLNAMRVADGLAVSLFASEPMLRNPTDLDVDEKGRVWVTEGVNYRVWQKWGKLRPAGDRIVILEDTDGDGLADKETTFYQGNEINTALGICVLGDRVYVSCSPNVFVFTRTNREDKADGPPRVLFSGISGVDNDHGVHAMAFGPDGRLYFNFGNASRQIRRADGSPLVDLDGNVVAADAKPYRQGMTFRCELDGSRFETLAWNFRNPYEVAVDSFGTIWQSDNDDDGNAGVRINYLMPFGNYGYTDEMTGAGWSDAWRKAASQGVPPSQKVFYEWHQFDPGVVPDLLHTGGGAPAGLCVYEGDLLPAVFRNQLVHCDAGPRVVRAYPVEADGAGYRARTVDLLTSSDTWFRPVDVCAGPDGSLLVADWNDAGVGGHYMADQDFATMTGRVYRLAPPGHRARPPRLSLTTPAGCVAALRSPNQATRYLAWHALTRMAGRATKALGKMAKDPNPRMRARALWVLARLPDHAAQAVDKALADADPNLRVAGLRIALASQLDVIPYLQRLVHDPSPQVRRECALSLHHNHSAAAPGLWADLANQQTGNDRWYLEALGIGADHQWDTFLGAWLTAVGDHWNTPGGRALLWRSRAKQTPALLAKLITDPATSAQDRDRYFRALDFINGPEKEAALVQLLTGAAGTGK